MKKVNFFAMLAAAALMTGVSSCSNDDNAGDGVIPTGQSAKLSVKVAAPPSSRAVGTAVPGDVMENYTVFVTDNTGAIAWTAYNSGGTSMTGTETITVSTSAQHVYVVANAGNLISSITTLSGLNAYLADLNGTGNQSAATNRWATGATSTPLSFTANGSSGDMEATANITLTFIAARITVKVDNQMTNTTDPSALTLGSIALLNARGESLLFPNATTGPLQGTLIPNAYTGGKKFYEGLANPVAPNAFVNYPAASELTLNATLLSNALTDISTEIYYYYVFENDATDVTEFPTIVTLVGTDSAGKSIYWPVHLTAKEQWTSGTFSTTGIQRGHSYNINITLKGDATNGGGGTTDPTKPVISASVEVNLTLTDWVPVDLEKEFN